MIYSESKKRNKTKRDSMIKLAAGYKAQQLKLTQISEKLDLTRKNSEQSFVIIIVSLIFTD